MENDIELIRTAEGIHTLRNIPLNECYHSIHGSLQESLHVFIQNGLYAHPNFSPMRTLHILEMGFGTGLNTLLTYREYQKRKAAIHYVAVEAFPLSMETINQLNYFDYLDRNLQPVFSKMHSCNWFENIILSHNPVSDHVHTEAFTFYKIYADMLELKLDDRFDLIYYDAFSPAHQPELWTFEALKKIYDACNAGAILVTYCAKGNVKRSLENAGFHVETMSGPRGKREMIRAVKSPFTPAQNGNAFTETNRYL
jgi:tRNA U34 5-methylaminomethyl-2-thiouridine-forming methyltransferase MnmC